MCSNMIPNGRSHTYDGSSLSTGGVDDCYHLGRHRTGVDDYEEWRISWISAYGSKSTVEITRDKEDDQEFHMAFMLGS